MPLRAPGPGPGPRRGCRLPLVVRLRAPGRPGGDARHGGPGDLIGFQSHCGGSARAAVSCALRAPGEGPGPMACGPRCGAAAGPQG
jgi:hypothetical protein